MAENLLPCPFCGPSTLKVDNWGAWYVKCEDCDARQTADTKDRAIAEWNRRPAMEAVAWREKVADAAYVVLRHSDYRPGTDNGLIPHDDRLVPLAIADAILQALAVIPTYGGGND